MPESAVPVVIAVVAVFSIFMVVVDGVTIWSNLPDSPRRD